MFQLKTNTVFNNIFSQNLNVTFFNFLFLFTTYIFDSLFLSKFIFFDNRNLMLNELFISILQV